LYDWVVILAMDVCMARIHIVSIVIISTDRGHDMMRGDDAMNRRETRSSRRVTYGRG
jgi:hypothetical protein